MLIIKLTNILVMESQKEQKVTKQRVEGLEVKPTIHRRVVEIVTGGHWQASL